MGHEGQSRCRTYTPRDARRDDITAAAQIYARAERVIICYGMGVTQHQQGSQLVQQIADLVNEKRLEGISDVRDESDENIRLVLVPLYLGLLVWMGRAVPRRRCRRGGGRRR